MVLFGEGVTAGRRALLAATADAQTFLLLPQGPLLVAADPLQLLLHAHPGPAALGRAQLLLHRAARTLLDGERRGGDTRWGRGEGGGYGGYRGGKKTNTLELMEAAGVFLKHMDHRQGVLPRSCVMQRSTRVSA